MSEEKLCKLIWIAIVVDLVVAAVIFILTL